MILLMPSPKTDRVYIGYENKLREFIPVSVCHIDDLYDMLADDPDHTMIIDDLKAKIKVTIAVSY